MRVLLTGATGFVGRHVLSALAEVDCDIFAITSHSQPIENNGRIKWITANLLCEEACNAAVAEAKADILIHMAWYAVHGKFWNAPENIDWSLASIGLLQAFARNGGKRAVLAGTCAEYDWQHGYCTEDVTPIVPSTKYGQCKDATRRLTKVLAEQAGIEWVWGRIFFPFGYGEPESRFLPSVLRSLLDNKPVLCTHGRQYRDFIPVEEVASAFVHLACKARTCGEFNVSSGVPVRLSRLVAFCVDYLGSSITPQFGAIKVSESEPLMLVGNNQKLMSSGWEQKTSWQSALMCMIQKYKQQEK